MNYLTDKYPPQFTTKNYLDIAIYTPVF